MPTDAYRPADWGCRHRGKAMLCDGQCRANVVGERDVEVGLHGGVGGIAHDEILVRTVLYRSIGLFNLLHGGCSREEALAGRYVG